MAYDMDQCPQSETEFKEYFGALVGINYGYPAGGWESKMLASYPWQGQMLRIPEGVGPGIKQQPGAPFFGLTQQISGNTPKGRIFLPANQADENGYYTRAIQYFDDAPQAVAQSGQQPKPHLNIETMSAKTTGLIWAWYHVAGHEYAPIQPAEGGGGGTTPTPPASTGLTEDQVQQMIDAAIKPLQEQIANAVKLQDKIALRTNSGLLMGIKGGGPTEADAPIEFIGKEGDPHAWESLTIEKGE